jgi:hypothetical protein
MRLLVVGLALAVASPALAGGNVTTTQTEDSITIKGDAADNDYDVKHGTDAQGNDVLVIEGKNGTTINGQPKFEIILNRDPNRFREVHIDYSGGGDDVTVDLSGVPEDRRLDELDVDADEAGTTTIKNTTMSPDGDIAVSPGGTVVIEDCDAESLGITGAGGGSVTVKGCNVSKKVKVDVSDSDTEVTIQDSFFGDTKVKGGSKVNVQNRLQFRVQRSQARKVSLGSGAGADEVAFEDSTVEQLSAKLGGGNDWISFTGTTAGKVGLDGGPGDDCFDDMQDQNVFASFKEKGFEPAACNGGAELEWFIDPFSNPEEPLSWPEDAVAWRTVNPANGHVDGPFALPGHGAALNLPERDPSDLAPPAHWGLGQECAAGKVEFFHVHEAWEGHGDPDDDGCGHGLQEWGRLAPI